MDPKEVSLYDVVELSDGLVGTVLESYRDGFAFDIELKDNDIVTVHHSDIIRIVWKSPK